MLLSSSSKRNSGSKKGNRPHSASSKLLKKDGQSPFSLDDAKVSRTPSSALAHKKVSEERKLKSSSLPSVHERKTVETSDGLSKLKEVSKRYQELFEKSSTAKETLSITEERLLGLTSQDIFDEAKHLQRAIFADAHKRLRRVQIVKDDFAADVADKSRQLQASEEKLDTLENALGEKESVIDKLQKRVEFLEKSLVNSRSQNEELAKQNDHLSKLSQAFAAEGSSDPTSLRLKLAEKEVEVQQMKDRIRKLEKEKGNSISEITQLEGTIRNLKAENRALEDKEKVTDERQRSLENALRNLQSRCTALNAEVELLRDQMAELEQQKVVLEKQQNREAVEGERLQRQLLSMREEVLSKADVQESIVFEEKRLRERMRHMQEELRLEQERGLEKQSSLDKMEERLRKKDDELRRAYEQKADAERALLTLQARNETKKAAVDKILTQVATRVLNVEWIGQDGELGAGNNGEAYRPSSPPTRQVEERVENEDSDFSEVPEGGSTEYQALD